MSIQRVKWAGRERFELADMQALSDLPVTTLAAVLRAGFQSGGVLRGGEVTADGSYVVTLAPLCAIDPNDPNGIVLIDTEQAVGPFAGNTDGSGYDRIDLVSVKYVESVVTGTRTFINSDATSSDDPSAQIRVVSGFDLQITQGTVAATPAVPDTPVGYIPLATVRVRNAGGGIMQSDVAIVGSSRSGADPSIFYPRYHWVGTYPSPPGPMNLPLALDLWVLPTLPESVVGLVNFTMVWHVGSLNPGELQVAVVAPDATIIAFGKQNVPETSTYREVTFSMSGIIKPGQAGGTYQVGLSRQVNQAGTPAGVTDCKLGQLMASVVFLPTTAPWPGYSHA